MANWYNFITRPIGDIFYVDQKEVYLQVVSDDTTEIEDGTCKGCYFHHPSNNGEATVSCIDFDIIGVCGGTLRDDGKSVHFVEVEAEPN